MSLLQNWRDTAYNEKDEKKQQQIWDTYFKLEKTIYEKILAKPAETVSGQVVALAEGFGVDLFNFTGFLDGINESLVKPLKLDELQDTDTIELAIDHEKLYYNMLEAKAEWLYTLPQWDSIIPAEKRKEITKKQRLSGTVVKEKEVGRNDACPCGSGKKYKKCCGK